MNEESKKLISEHIASLYNLADEIVKTVNGEGRIKVKFPFRISKEELELAIFTYIESHIKK